MTDIATLGLRVDSTQAATGAKNLDALAVSARAAETAATKLARQSTVAGTALKLNAGQVQNLSYQLNDLVVGLVSGQNAATVFAQQGAQIAQVFGSGVGVAAALRATGTALVSFVTNPLTLAVIGMSAAAGAAQVLYRVISGSSDAEAALKRHKELIDAVRDAYGQAGQAATRYVQDSAAMLQFGLGKQVKQEFTAYVDALDSFDRYIRQRRAYGNFGVQLFGPLTGQADDFIRSIRNGTASAMAFSDSLASIANATNDADVRSYAGALIDLLKPMVELQRQALQTAGALNAVRSAGILAKSDFGVTGRTPGDRFDVAFGDFAGGVDEMRAGLLGMRKTATGSVTAALDLRPAVSSVAALNTQLLTTQDLFGGLASQIRRTGNLFDALADRALSALDKIADKLLDQALSGLFGSLFGGIGGGLASGFGLGTGLAAGMPSGLYANGAAFLGGRVTAFASGGVVDRPSLFGMAGGAGLMGESGPEAVMPLRRLANGRLGVESMSGAGGPRDVHVIVSVDQSGNLTAAIERVSRRQIEDNNRNKIPRLVAEHKNKTIITTGGR